MHRSSSIVAGLVVLLAIATVAASSAFAQYVPGGFDPYLSWGAYPAMNAAAENRTIYAEKSAAQRQSLAQIQQRHSAQNQFLMSQSRGQSQFAAENSRAASEAWLRANQPRQSIVYSAPAAVAPPSSDFAMPARLPSSGQAATPYDQTVDWPSLLKSSAFREPRVRIETIMTKAEPGGAGLTETDYQEVVMAVNRMKDTLKRMTERLNAAEYIGVVNYLDELVKRAGAAVKR